MVNVRVVLLKMLCNCRRTSCKIMLRLEYLVQHIGKGMGVAAEPWPHLNFDQILTKFDLTLMMFCEIARNFL